MVEKLHYRDLNQVTKFVIKQPENIDPRENDL